MFKSSQRSNGTHDHKTIDVTSYQLSKPTIKTECDIHGQQLNLYCPSHLIPCCDECFSKSHSKCKEIKSLISEVEKTNIEKPLKSVEADIISMMKFLEKLVNTKSKNIKTVEQKYLGIKESVKEIRKEINKQLDNLEIKLCQETDTIWNQEKSKATNFISEIERKRESLKEMNENIRSITEHNNSKLQSFLGVYQIELQVHQFQRYIDNLENDERAKAVDITMKQNDEIEGILSKLESITSLGEVMVVKTAIDLKRETAIKRKAQVESRQQSNINNMTINIETKIQPEIGELIRDMICLMDGRIIVVNGDGKVILLSTDCKLQKYLPVSDVAWSVTQINQNTIAITYPGTDIKIFNMEKETVTKFIKLDKTSYGISFSNNYLAVGLNDDEIRIIDLEGNTKNTIQVQSRSNLYNLVYYNDRLIYSDLNGRSVTCIDTSGKQIWQYKEDLTGPTGLCTDVHGNIIVADHVSGKIIVISNDGQNSKELIRREKGLYSSKCICVNHIESSGYICEYLGTYLAKFNLSYG
ncbi:unnamed protein product [Mytilus edulis]|uniref:B box-type domain-containing protein n=1 Tax=Mytilus edulis TaxID=6550 RepID=A0A8S3RCD6_MYTED|nr:unnamed protein product [Mytilus edulis]